MWQSSSLARIVAAVGYWVPLDYRLSDANHRRQLRQRVFSNHSELVGPAFAEADAIDSKLLPLSFSLSLLFETIDSDNPVKPGKPRS